MEKTKGNCRQEAGFELEGSSAQWCYTASLFGDGIHVIVLVEKCLQGFVFLKQNLLEVCSSGQFSVHIG